MRPEREKFRNTGAAYFVSTQTASRKPFFRHERWARLMLDVLRHYDGTGYKLHAYVIMPDHLHLLITPKESVEKAVQLIKGGFSFRAKRELEWKFDIWQQGFTDHRIRDEEDWQRHLEYIRTNPIEARLVEDAVLYEFMGVPSIAFPQGLKPTSLVEVNVRAETRTLHEPGGADVRAQDRTLRARQDVQPQAPALQGTPAPNATRENVKGTGFSPSEKATSLTGALAPGGGKRSCEP